jgi:COP9 signalosome complex subunit 6
VIISLLAKANAIKMLKSRLAVITAFLQSQAPPNGSASYLTDASIPKSSSTLGPADLEIIRSAAALSSQLNLVPPSDLLAFDEELIKEQTNVELVVLLSTLTKRVNEVVALGNRRALMERGKKKKAKNEAVTTKFIEQLRSL